MAGSNLLILFHIFRLLTCVFPQGSHAMILLAVEEMRSLVGGLPGNAALEVAYHFVMVGLVDSALVNC